MSKTESQMELELCNLWDNTELYNFMFGEEYISKRENEICQSIIDLEDRDKFIIDKVITWASKQN